MQHLAPIVRVVVGDVTRGPVLAKESDDVEDVVKRMERAGIRRIPVVDEGGSLTGIIAIDDAIGILSNRALAISIAARLHFASDDLQNNVPIGNDSNRDMTILCGFHTL